MEGKLFSQRLAAALQNTEHLPDPSILMGEEVAEGDTVIATVSPVAQGVFVFAETLNEEYVAAKKKFTGTSACCTTCPCGRIEEELSLVRSLFWAIARESLSGVGPESNLGIRKGWTIVSCADTPEDMRATLRDLFGGAFIIEDDEDDGLPPGVRMV